MKMDREKNLISIIMPSLNEEKSIGKTIDSIPKSELSKLGYRLEIIVVDGDSTDSTREIATLKGAKVILEKRKGYGRAYKTGFRSASDGIIVTLDADGTYPAELIPDYVQELQDKKLDFITVNRFSHMERGSMNMLHKIGNRILSIAMRLIYSVNVRDSQSGMWLMRRSFVDAINLSSDNMSMSEEIKIIAFKFFRATEFDGRYYRRLGKAKLDTFKHGWKNLKYLIEYRSLLYSCVNVKEEVIAHEFMPQAETKV